MILRGVLLLSLLACGKIDHEASGEVDTNSTLRHSISIEFPTCALIQDPELIVTCVEAATTVIIKAEGVDGLTNKQIDIIENIDRVTKEETAQ